MRLLKTTRPLETFDELQKDAADALQAAEHSLGVRASNAIAILDEISQDPNMPAYTRVKLWNVASVT
jgi:uncharacterized protein (UPF0147 family)